MSIRRAFVCFAIALFASATAGSEPRVVELVCDPWPPYVMGEMGGEATVGAGVDVMRAIFDRLNNVELYIGLMPWKRALREVERGNKDGIAILLKTPEREEYMLYSDVVFTSHNAVWFTESGFPNGFDWRDYADLQRYKIGVIRGHSYGGDLDQIIAAKTFRVTQLSSAEQLFAMLDKGRIDLAIADRLVGGALIKQYARQGMQFQFVAADRPAATEVYHISLSRQSAHRDLLPAINQAIAELRDEGVIQTLVGEVNQQ